DLKANQRFVRYDRLQLAGWRSRQFVPVGLGGHCEGVRSGRRDVSRLSVATFADLAFHDIDERVEMTVGCASLLADGVDFSFVHFGDGEEGANALFSAGPSFVGTGPSLVGFLLPLLLGLGKGIDLRA